MNRLKGLDSLRFICALIVVLGHFGIPKPEYFLVENSIGIYKIIRGITIRLANGPAAVIVFFIISGFCIHYPNRNNYTLKLKTYYIRRLTRIIPPAVIAYAIQKYSGEDVSLPLLGVFWSIICEVVYYILYPLFLWFLKFFSWAKLIVFAFVCAYTLTLTHLQTFKSYHGAYCALGMATWIIGLPCWLLGCWLAENCQRFPVYSSYKIWVVRFFILLLTIGLKIFTMNSNSILSNNGVTLNIFSIFASIWVGLEIAYYQNNKPIGLLEIAGQWSYSLYVIHSAIPRLFSFITQNKFLFNYQKLAFLILALIIGYFFFLSVERPFHRLALRLTPKNKIISPSIL